jgi:hypothetical protein
MFSFDIHCSAHFTQADILKQYNLLLYEFLPLAKKFEFEPKVGKFCQKR